MLVVRNAKGRSRDREELLQYYRKHLMKKQGSLGEIMEDVIAFSNKHNFRYNYYFGLYSFHLWFGDDKGGSDVVSIPYDRFVDTAPGAGHYEDPYEVRAEFKLRNGYCDNLVSCVDLNAAKKFADDLVKYFPDRIVGAAVVDPGMDINYQIQEIIYEAKAGKETENE